MKTMAKIEVRSVWVMLVYFVTCACLVISRIPSAVHNVVTRHMQNGLAEMLDLMNSSFIAPTRLFNDNIIAFMSVTFLGILFLVYLSFRNESHHETGRFLKSLPFTSKDRYFVKVGVGLATFTIPYILYAIFLIIARHYYLSKLGALYEITLLNRIYPELLPLGSILQFLLVTYLFIVAAYLFIMLFEYLISNNLASIIIGLLIGMAPLFISESLLAIFRTPLLSKLNHLVNYFYCFLPNTTQVACFIGENATEYYALASVETVSLLGLSSLFSILISIICIVASLWLCKRKALEKDDILMPDKAFRWLFVIGVTICSGLLFADIYLAFHYRDTMRIVWLLIGSIVGFILSWLISNIGLRKFKGARK